MTPIKQSVGRFVNLDEFRIADNGRTNASAALGEGVFNGLSDANKEVAVYSQARKVLESELQGKTSDLLSPVTPFAVRQVIIASYNAKVDGRGLSDGDYIRMKNFWSGLTVGFVFTMIARAIRVSLRVAFIWLSTLVSIYQQLTYSKMMPENKKYNIVFEDWKRIGYEFVDLGATIVTPIIAFINTLAPNAISTDWLRDYYIERIDQVRDRNATFNAARDAYNADQEQKNAVWHAAQG